MAGSDGDPTRDGADSTADGADSTVDADRSSRGDERSDRDAGRSSRDGERSVRGDERTVPECDPASDADVGLWLIGARGTVGVSTIVGALALGRGATDGTGLATARPPCNRLDLPDPGAIAIGGHEIRDGDLLELARELHGGGGPGDDRLIDRIEPALRAVDRRIRPGTVRGCGDAVRALAEDGHVMEALAAGGVETEPVDRQGASRGVEAEDGDDEADGVDAGEPNDDEADGVDAREPNDDEADGVDARESSGDVAASAVVEHLRADLQRFRARHDLETVVVVNLASPEPPVRTPGAYQRREDVERAVETDDPELPASALYAYAALLEGCPYANCAQSTGASLPGFRELAVEAGVPHAGTDAKTGASLVESALAPLFAGRNLEVRAWEGQDVLERGSRDAESWHSQPPSRRSRAGTRRSRDGATAPEGRSVASAGRSPGAGPTERRSSTADASPRRGSAETIGRDDGSDGRDTGRDGRDVGRNGRDTGRDGRDGEPSGNDGEPDEAAGSRRTGPSRATERRRPAPETSDGALAGILEDLADSRARIDHARTVGNWTRSWDYVHLEGFLGAEMTVEFTWDGAEAPLAAPLVLDLARLLVHAERRGEAGVQRHLSAFFASPLGVEEHALGAQLDALEEYVERHARRPTGPTRASD